MNRFYDAYMCRTKRAVNASSMTEKNLPYKLICMKCGADRTYESNHQCLVIDAVTMAVKPYIDAHTGTDAHIIRK